MTKLRFTDLFSDLRHVLATERGGVNGDADAGTLRTDPNRLHRTGIARGGLRRKQVTSARG